MVKPYYIIKLIHVIHHFQDFKFVIYSNFVNVRLNTGHQRHMKSLGL